MKTSIRVPITWKRGKVLNVPIIFGAEYETDVIKSVLIDRDTFNDMIAIRDYHERWKAFAEMGLDEHNPRIIFGYSPSIIVLQFLRLIYTDTQKATWVIDQDGQLRYFTDWIRNDVGRDAAEAIHRAVFPDLEFTTGRVSWPSSS